ncbi:hypothetical protein [Mycobacterium persicum]|uniref:hypothetical protein n=1 Tax=Mycobacterium persicum TaxID=1487726 RepID=UPI0009F4643F|nr:hypothetical protein [Mycobacterium persicum]ORB33337.1 hypothetical protein BST40_26630 [Mycobacterium persicum]
MVTAPAAQSAFTSIGLMAKYTLVLGASLRRARFEDILSFDPMLRGGYTAVACDTWQPDINNVTQNAAAATGFFTTGRGIN